MTNPVVERLGSRLLSSHHWVYQDDMKVSLDAKDMPSAIREVLSGRYEPILDTTDGFGSVLTVYNQDLCAFPTGFIVRFKSCRILSSRLGELHNRLTPQQDPRLQHLREVISVSLDKIIEDNIRAYLGYEAFLTGLTTART